MPPGRLTLGSRKHTTTNLSGSRRIWSPVRYDLVSRRYWMTHAARTVDPWKSKAYNHEFEWFAKDMVPVRYDLVSRRYWMTHAARTVDPWKSKAYNHEFEWFAKDMVPCAV